VLDFPNRLRGFQGIRETSTVSTGGYAGFGRRLPALLVATHEGGFSPFEADVTGRAAPGGVRVFFDDAGRHAEAPGVRFGAAR